MVHTSSSFNSGPLFGLDGCEAGIRVGYALPIVEEGCGGRVCPVVVGHARVWEQ